MKRHKELSIRGVYLDSIQTRLGPLPRMTRADAVIHYCVHTPIEIIRQDMDREWLSHELARRALNAFAGVNA